MQTAKITSKEIQEGRSDVVRVKPENIVVEEGHNERIFSSEKVQKHIKMLQVQIQESGQLMPVRAWFDQNQGKYVLVDGQCRWTAIKNWKQELLEAGKDEEAKAITVKLLAVSKSECSKENRIWEMIQSNTSLPFSPVELGKSYLKLNRLGVTMKQIAERSGCSLGKINNLITLAQAPQSLLNMVHEGVVKYTTVVKAFNEASSWDEVSEKFTKIVESKMQLVEAEKTNEGDVEVAELKGPKKAAKKPKAVKITANDVSETDATLAVASSKNALSELIDAIEPMKGKLAEEIYNVLLMLQDGQSTDEIVKYIASKE
jgi:ParB-like chromosome segregation protein Spo0J